MKTFREFLNERMSKIASRMKILIKHLDEGYLTEAITDSKLIYNDRIVRNALKEIESFEGKFIDELHSKSLSVKKVDLDVLTDKEFLEWLSIFIDSYYMILSRNIKAYIGEELEILRVNITTEILPKRLIELVQEFNKFVNSIRVILSFAADKRVVSRDEKIIFNILTGKDIDRLTSKDYDLSELAKQMKDPIIIESDIREETE